MKKFNDEVFNKDGQPTRRKFRVYCFHEGCDKYTIGRWGGGGYAGITTTDGTFDWRNQIWMCDRHTKEG